MFAAETAVGVLILHESKPLLTVLEPLRLCASFVVNYGSDPTVIVQVLVES